MNDLAPNDRVSDYEAGIPSWSQHPRKLSEASGHVGEEGNPAGAVAGTVASVVADLDLLQRLGIKTQPQKPCPVVEVVSIGVRIGGRCHRKIRAGTGKREPPRVACPHFGRDTFSTTDTGEHR